MKLSYSTSSRTSHFFPIAAFVIAWIPFVGVITMPLSIIGLIMAAISVVLIALKKSTGAGYAISGLVVCGIALYIASAWVYAATEIGEAIEGNSGAKQKVVSSDGKQKEATEPDIWADAKEAVQLENIQIKVLSVIIDNAPIETIGGRTESENKALMIKLEIKNVSETAKVSYDSWLGAIITKAGVKDNFENVYRPRKYLCTITILVIRGFGMFTEFDSALFGCGESLRGTDADLLSLVLCKGR
ncbi:MAG: hypothetical protein P8P30_00990 [Rickettsiales bacterium]|nr:hypothetical protein [Rickettsiales bacterium]